MSNRSAERNRARPPKRGHSPHNEEPPNQRMRQDSEQRNTRGRWNEHNQMDKENLNPSNNNFENNRNYERDNNYQDINNSIGRTTQNNRGGFENTRGRYERDGHEKNRCGRENSTGGFENNRDGFANRGGNFERQNERGFATDYLNERHRDASNRAGYGNNRNVREIDNNLEIYNNRGPNYQQNNANNFDQQNKMEYSNDRVRDRSRGDPGNNYHNNGGCNDRSNASNYDPKNQKEFSNDRERDRSRGDPGNNYHNNGGCNDRSNSSGFDQQNQIECSNDRERDRSRGETRGNFHNNRGRNNRYSLSGFDQQNPSGRVSEYQNDRQRYNSNGVRGRGGGGIRENYNNRTGGQSSFGNEQMIKVEPGPIELMTNFFEVKCLDTNLDWVLYQYHVTFEPDIQSKALRSGLLKDHFEMFKNSRAFDGSTIYSMIKLPDRKTVVRSQTQRDSNIVHITIDLVKEIHPGDDQTIQIFNIIFKRCLKRCNFQEFGKERAYFDFQNMHRLGNHNLNIVSGYKASIELYGERLLLCTELASKLINKSTVLDIMESMYQEFKRNAEEYKSAVEKRLIGQTVITNYNKRTYKIDDIDWESSAGGVFQLRNKEEISFYDYYKKNYKLEIKNRDQPLLVSRPKQKDINRGEPSAILLIPEFCALTGQGLMDMKNFNMKRDLDQITKLDPEMRHQKLTRFLQTLKNKKEAQVDFDNWQMKLGDDLLNLNARVLKPVKIKFTNFDCENTTNGWDNEIKRNKQLSMVELNEWCIFYMPRDQKKAEMVKNELLNVSGGMGFNISNSPIMVRLPDARGQVGSLFASEIRNYINSSKKPQLILCILPGSDKTAYSIIKKTCCLEFFVPSQVITEKILDENKMGKTKSVITKVAIQMNCKLGGEAWGIYIPLKRVMIIGIDLYKDSSDRNQSVLAFVASMNGDDRNCSRYYSRVVMQERKASYSDRLQILMQDALDRYLKVNGYLPDGIMIYRDGVSDSQLKDIAEYEIDRQIRVSLKAFANYNPRLTFVVVQKRGNTRFFYKGPDGRYINAPMGTAVDNTVTGRKIINLKKDFRRNKKLETETDLKPDNLSLKMMKDFFLVSQSVRQGTVSPSHFRVLTDDYNLSDEKIQTFTYMLTHMYYNWPGQIRVPAPCQYAQKLAHLVGESLHQEHHPGLDNLLFYL